MLDVIIQPTCGNSEMRKRLSMTMSSLVVLSARIFRLEEVSLITECYLVAATAHAHLIWCGVATDAAAVLALLSFFAPVPATTRPSPSPTQST